jgi:spermidine/putrescine transport system permease protein
MDCRNKSGDDTGENGEMNRPGSIRLSTLAAIVYAALIYLFIFVPVLVLMLFSLQGSQIPVPPFNGPSLRWYAQVLGDGGVTEALWNSVLVAAFSSAVALLLGFLAAFGFARFDFRGSALFRGLITAPLAVSYLIIGMGLLFTFNASGFPKSLLAVGIGHVVINLPLAFAIIYSQMGDHQINIERAARDLGANDWQVLWLVTAPMLWPALFAAFFLSMTFSWDEFVIAFLLTRFEVTLPVEIWNMMRGGLSPKTNAIGSIVFLISIAFVLAAELTVFRRKRG